MDRSPQTVAEEYLVIAARQGDAEALNDLLRRWEGRLWRFACSLTGDEHDAREVYQETCLGIARGIHRLNDVATFPKWAYTIASRRYADLVRRAGRQRRLRAGIAAEFAEPEAEAGTAETRLFEALDSVSAADRRLLCLAYLEEWSHADLASLLGVPAGTVKSRLFHARQRLKSKMQKDE